MPEQISTSPQAEIHPDEPTGLTEIYGPLIARNNPNAAEFVRDKVAAIRADGDYYDTRRSLHLPHVLLHGTLPAVVLCELAATDAPLPTPFGVAVGALAAGASWWHTRFRDARHRWAQSVSQPTAEDVSVATREHLDFFRTGPPNDKGDVHAIWYGAALGYYEGGEDPVPSALDRLHFVACLARENDVATLRVTRNVTDQLPNIVNGLNFLSLALLKHKKVALFSTHTEVVSKSPDEWLALIDESRVESPTPQSLLRTLGDKLTALQPEHPLASLLTNNKLPEDIADLTQPNLARTMARQAVERRLHRQEIYPEVVAQAIYDDQPVRKHEALSFEHGRLSADGRRITWQTRNGPLSQDVLEAASLGGVGRGTDMEQDNDTPLHPDQQYRDMLNAPLEAAKDNLTRTVTALEVAIMQSTHGIPIPMSPSLEATSQQKPLMPDENVKRLQASLNDPKEQRRLLRWHRVLQVSGVLFAGMIIGSISGPIHDRAEVYEELAVDRAVSELANQRNIPVNRVPHIDAVDHAYKTNASLRIWRPIKAADEIINWRWSGLTELFKEHDLPTPEKPSEYPSSSNTHFFGVGNAGGTDETTDYELTAYNRADPTGFWATDTSNKLMVGELAHTEKAVITWGLENDNYTGGRRYNIATSVPESDQNKPYIKVHRYLNPPVFTDAEKTSGSLGDAASIYGRNVMSIPVLEGTIPIAAALDGKSVKLYQKPDNTYAIEASGEYMEGKLDYWLAPRATAPHPKARAPIEIDGVISLFGPKTRALIKQWESGDLPDDQGARAREIASTWKYALNPFPAKSHDSWKSFDDFVASAEKKKLANCNIANTIANLANPRQNQVMGYSNAAGSDSDTLSSGEGHERLTGYDATPTVLAEVPKPKGSILPDLPEAPYVPILAGATVVWQRRRIGRASMRVVQTAIAHNDNRIDARKSAVAAQINGLDYATTLAMTNLIDYAPGGPTAPRLAQLIERHADNPLAAQTPLLKQRHITIEQYQEVLTELTSSSDETVREAAATSIQTLSRLNAVRDLADGRRETAERLNAARVAARDFRLLARDAVRRTLRIR